jgi:hypothetical protein
MFRILKEDMKTAVANTMTAVYTMTVRQRKTTAMAAEDTMTGRQRKTTATAVVTTTEVGILTEAILAAILVAISE